MIQSETTPSERPALRLGVNIDHVATVRNARGGAHPDPIRAAEIAAEAGADGITAHLREDRRHIIDDDLPRLMAATALPLNLEMAATDEMAAIATALGPHAVCLVPERREERTTEGGLDVAGDANRIADVIGRLAEAGRRVSLFIEADPRQIEAARRAAAPVIELHTGRYCEALVAGDQAAAAADLARLRAGAALGVELGLEVHAGHGITFDSVTGIAAIETLSELNIGHFLVGEAIFQGLAPAIRQMRGLMRAARGEAATDAAGPAGAAGP